MKKEKKFTLPFPTGSLYFVTLNLISVKCKLFERPLCISVYPFLTNGMFSFRFDTF